MEKNIYIVKIDILKARHLALYEIFKAKSIENAEKLAQKYMFNKYGKEKPVIYTLSTCKVVDELFNK